MSPERWIEIPEAVREIYALWRPTPLLRAIREKKQVDDDLTAQLKSAMEEFKTTWQ